MILLSGILAASAVGTCFAGELMTFGGKDEFSVFTISGGRWESERGGIAASRPVAVVESRELRTRSVFDQVIVSWNAFTPPGASIDIECRARRDAGEWTRWYALGTWNTSGCDRARTSVKGQKDERGRVDTDTLVLTSPANALAVRFRLRCSADGASPVLRFAAVSAVDSRKSGSKPKSATSRGSSGANRKPEAWGTQLPVPRLSQLSVEGGRPWCSPTSTAMVLGYWSAKLNRPELSVGIADAARAVHDEAWGGTGNWVFNTAYAGEFEGIRAYVARLRGIADIEKWISRGVPVILSLDYNELNRRGAGRSMGHLVVVVGFTPSGDPIINDPWARLENGESVRKVFPRADLDRAWLGSTGSLGTVYLIYPETLDR